MSSLARNDSPENVSKSPLASRLSRDNKSGGLEHKHTKHGGEGKQPVTQVDEVRAEPSHGWDREGSLAIEVASLAVSVAGSSR